MVFIVDTEDFEVLVNRYMIRFRACKSLSDLKNVRNDLINDTHSDKNGGILDSSDNGLKTRAINVACERVRKDYNTDKDIYLEKFWLGVSIDDLRRIFVACENRIPFRERAENIQLNLERAALQDALDETIKKRGWTLNSNTSSEIKVAEDRLHAFEQMIVKQGKNPGSQQRKFENTQLAHITDEHISGEYYLSRYLQFKNLFRNCFSAKEADYVYAVQKEDIGRFKREQRISSNEADASKKALDRARNEWNSETFDIHPSGRKNLSLIKGRVLGETPLLYPAALPPSKFEKLKQLISGEKTMIEGQEAKQLYGATVVLPTKFPKGPPKQITGRIYDQLTGQTPKQIHGQTIVEVYPPSITLSIGGYQKFTALVRDPDGNEIRDAIVSWRISDNTVGVIHRDISLSINNARCVFNALGPGTATITATANGVDGIATATVNPAQQPLPQPQPVIPTVTPPTVTPRPPFTKYFLLKLPNILLILIGMSLFGMEQASYGGGNYQFNYTVFVGGGVLLSIFAIFASYFVPTTNQQNTQQQGGGGTP